MQKFALIDIDFYTLIYRLYSRFIIITILWGYNLDPVLVMFACRRCWSVLPCWTSWSKPWNQYLWPWSTWLLLPKIIKMVGLIIKVWECIDIYILKFISVRTNTRGHSFVTNSRYKLVYKLLPKTFTPFALFKGTSILSYHIVRTFVFTLSVRNADCAHLVQNKTI